jgi:prepilin-type N-terminal cleavage/methylation domain-containing protein
MTRTLPIDPIGRRDAAGFTLLEILVAVTVLSMMMVFMFTLLGHAISTWEIGNRRMEAAQMARVGLNRMASDLEYAFAGVAVAPNLSGSDSFTNISPIAAFNNASPSIPGVGAGNLASSPGSDQIYFIGTSGDPSNDVFQKLGYVCALVTNPDGYDFAAPLKYYLFRRSRGGAGDDFHLRNTSTSLSLGGSGAQFVPLVDNCVRMELQYASTNSGSLAFSDTWTSTTSLPAGILVTLVMIDSKAATKISQSKGTSPLTAEEIDSITNFSLIPPTPEAAILRRGSATMRRFIPFHNSGSIY